MMRGVFATISRGFCYCHSSAFCAHFERICYAFHAHFLHFRGFPRMHLNAEPPGDGFCFLHSKRILRAFSVHLVHRTANATKCTQMRKSNARHPPTPLHPPLHPHPLAFRCRPLASRVMHPECSGSARALLFAIGLLRLGRLFLLLPQRGPWPDAGTRFFIHSASLEF